MLRLPAGDVMPKMGSSSLLRDTAIDMKIRQRKKLTTVGVTRPQRPGSMERGNAIRTERSNAITKPTSAARITEVETCGSRRWPRG
jgi:hypothetical protein